MVSARIGGLAITADVSDPEQLDSAFARCVDVFGRLDVAHLNAGVSLGAGDVAELDVENYRRSIGVNIDHIVFGTRAAVRAIRRSEPDGGPRAVVATASIAGLEPFYPDAIYTLTKHAVVGFIRAIAPDLARDGIAAHVVCPGLTDTGMLNPERKELLLRAGMPLVEPERIADAVVAAISSPLGCNRDVLGRQSRPTAAAVDLRPRPRSALPRSTSLVPDEIRAPPTLQTMSAHSAAPNLFLYRSMTPEAWRRLPSPASDFTAHTIVVGGEEHHDAEDSADSVQRLAR